MPQAVSELNFSFPPINLARKLEDSQSAHEMRKALNLRAG